MDNSLSKIVSQTRKHTLWDNNYHLSVFELFSDIGIDLN